MIISTELKIMKEWNEQSEKILNIARERRAVRTEMNFSKVLLIHKQSQSRDCQELLVLQEQIATLLTLLRQGMKKYICVLSDRCINTIRSLVIHSACFDISFVASL